MSGWERPSAWLLTGAANCRISNSRICRILTLTSNGISTISSSSKVSSHCTTWREEQLRYACARLSPPPGRDSAGSRRRPMRTREALLPDAERIQELISHYSADGTLLPRTLAEICENVRDFIVLEEAGRIIGCGALHLYGLHLAEIRSITVHRTWQKRGGGELLVQSLMSQARKHHVTCICLFTRSP